MRNEKHIANAHIEVKATLAEVWDALTNPEKIKLYMFGTTVVSDWDEGSPIIWKGEWQGHAYEDKGMIIKAVREQLIQYSHISGAESKDEYHIVTIKLSSSNGIVWIDLTQDNNTTDEARKESEKNWNVILEGLKKILEQ